MSVIDLDDAIAVISGYFSALLVNVQQIINDIIDDELQQAFIIILIIVFNIFSEASIKQASSKRILKCELKFLTDSVKKKNLNVLMFLKE